LLFDILLHILEIMMSESEKAPPNNVNSKIAQIIEESITHSISIYFQNPY
jgi:hypothetical protein